MEVNRMPARPAIKPMPAITGLLEQFATHPLVALGEMHGLQEEADFITALLHHPAFPATVQVIVYEVGNARHQAVVDRFVAGEPIAARDLRPVWRDIIGWGFDHPIYEQFFRTVRAINRTLPAAQRLRVRLGDPPVDWSQIQFTLETEHIWQEQRDAHFTEVVETQVLAPGHHGLLIAGTAHFVRDWPSQFQPPLPENVVQRLERKHPGSVHVIFPHIGFGPENSTLEPYLADWPIPSLASLRTTWLGELSAALHLNNFSGPPPVAGWEPPPLKPGFTFGHMADSYLYLGPRSSLTRSMVNPAIYRGDEQYLSYLHRRESTYPGIFNVDSLLTEGDPRYFPE
jgi:hypothetical protein